MHYVPKQIKLGSISTSDTEIKDIIKAWIAISVAFVVGIIGLDTTLGFYTSFIISSLTVGIGFLLHEMGHKMLAQRFGCYAEFRSFDMMLILAILMSFFGLIFAAPGAVMISGRVSEKKGGMISAAGPIVNLLLALIFLALLFSHPSKLIEKAAYYGFLINSWLALFNMLPFWVFDGQKVWRWNKFFYGILALAAAGIMSIQYFIKIPG